jgi:hypothetical protein
MIKDKLLEFSYIAPKDKKLSPECNFIFNKGMALVEIVGFITIIIKSLETIMDDIIRDSDAQALSGEKVLKN